MINPAIVIAIDDALDQSVSEIYRNQPLAQDWARVGKVIEELGEAISELIAFTGQNPRKPQDDEAFMRMLAELADTAMTGIYGIQHFTKDIKLTEEIMRRAQNKHSIRAAQWLSEKDTR